MLEIQQSYRNALLIVFCLCFAIPLFAQNQSNEVSLKQEAFQVIPRNIPAGAQGFEVRLVANESGLFATNSLRSPEIDLGAGVELEQGSFRVLSPNESVLKVNVLDNFLGGVEIGITFYVLDGSEELRKERATLSVVGPFDALQDNSIKVSVDEVRLIQVNTEEEQQAGSIFITGKMNGTLDLKLPTGLIFSPGREPKASLQGGGEVSSQSINETNSNLLSIKIANPSLAQTQLQIANIFLRTKDFSSLGGSLGNLASLLSGSALEGEEVLVVHAYTGLESLGQEEIRSQSEEENELNDNTQQEEENTEEQTPSSGGGLGSGGSISSSSSSNSSSRGEDDSSTESTSTTSKTSRSTGARRSLRTASRMGSTRKPSGHVRRSSSRVGRLNNRHSQDEQRNNLNYGPRGTHSSGSSQDKEISGGKAEASAASVEDLEKTKAISEFPQTKKFESSKTLYFADKDFKPLSSVILQATQNKKYHKQKVWVVLERGADLTPEVDTVKVTLRLGGKEREITLKETGAQTAVFHSKKEGIDITDLSGGE